jgi:hypothetical protein
MKEKPFRIRLSKRDADGLRLSSLGAFVRSSPRGDALLFVAAQAHDLWLALRIMGRDELVKRIEKVWIRRRPIEDLWLPLPA